MVFYLFRGENTAIIGPSKNMCLMNKWVNKGVNMVHCLFYSSIVFCGKITYMVRVPASGRQPVVRGLKGWWPLPEFEQKDFSQESRDMLEFLLFLKYMGKVYMGGKLPEAAALPHLSKRTAELGGPLVTSSHTVLLQMGRLRLGRCELSRPGSDTRCQRQRWWPGLPTPLTEMTSVLSLVIYPSFPLVKNL